MWLQKKHIIPLLIVLIAGGYGIKRLLDFHGQWRSQISRFIPADINGDGKPEMILVYKQHPYWKRSLVEALELPGRKRLWSVEIPPQNTDMFLQKRSFFQIAGTKLFLLNHGYKDQKRFLHLTALNITEGKKLWEQQLPPKHELCLYAGMSVWKERLMVFTRRGGGILLTQYHQETGHKIKELGIPDGIDYPRPPQIFGNHLVLPTLTKTHILQIETGEWKSIRSSYSGFKQSGKHLYFASARGRYQLREIQFPALKTRTLLSGLNDLGEPRLLSPGDILYASSLFHENRPQRLSGRSLDGKAGVKSITLPQEWAFSWVGDEWQDFSPNVSAFHQVSSRYLPFLLMEREEDKKTHNRSRRLVVFDRKDFKFAWQSPVLKNTTSFYPRNIFKAGKRFIIHANFYNPEKKTHAPFLLVLKGETGKFEAFYSLRVKGQKKFYPYNFSNYSQPWNVHGDLFFATDGKQFWAIDLKAKRLRFHDPDRVRLKVNPPEAEKYFGKLPRP